MVVIRYIVLPCLVLALPFFLFANPYDYKLYYSQEFGILYDTKSKHIDLLCKHLSNIMDTIDDTYHCKHQSSILNQTKDKLTITIQARYSPTQRPQVTLHSKNKSFLKAARRLTTLYFFHFKELPPPPISYQHHPPAYEEITTETYRERSDVYRIEYLEHEEQLPLRERANARVSEDDRHRLFLPEVNDTIGSTRQEQDRRCFLSHNGRVFPLPTRYPTYRESFVLSD